MNDDWKPVNYENPCEMKDWSRNSSYLRLWGQLLDVYLERNL